MNYLLLFFISIISSAAFAANYTVLVGDSPVVIHTIQGKGKTFVHLHQNERTALKAAKSYIRKKGGSLITLRHSGGRTIKFHLKKVRYEFDPNRIFTPKGIKKTLALYSHYSPLAQREVNKLALKIKHVLPKGKVIAVHNNCSYSIKDYLPHHKYENEAKAIHLTHKKYFRNFYLLTKTKDYKRLKSKGFNEILQHSHASDDGSLSIFLAKKSYVNVEAGYDQLPEQIKMLRSA